MILILGIPGAWSSERLREEFAKRGEAVLMLPAESLAVSMSPGEMFWQSRTYGPLPRLDGIRAVVVKKLGDLQQPATRNRLNLLRMSSTWGIPVFNTPEVIETLIDRQRMLQVFAGFELPIPETLVTESAEEVVEWVSEKGDAVVKPAFTTKGRGMVRLNRENVSQWREILEAFQHDHGMPYCCQRFIAHGGRDIGISVVSGRICCAYARQSPTRDWQTSTLSGGVYAHQPVTPEMISVVEKIQAVFPTDFTTVDLVREEGGGLYLLELSAFGGFRGSEKAAGVNIAGEIVDHVLTSVLAYA